MDARLSVTFPGHPKTKKLLRRLGPLGAWKLVCLILWAAQNKPSGDFSGLTAEDIELAIDWDGEPGEYVRTMVEVGFFDGSEGSYSLHDWTEHNPWAAGAEARSEKAKWAALCKQHGRMVAAELMPEYAERLLESASSKQSAVPRSASGTRLAQSGFAPSPSPNPNPIPNNGVEPEGFAACWEAYPKREGSNSRKEALKAYAARMRQGVTPEELLAGVQRYAAYVEAKGQKGTAYVKQAASFFGAGEHWKESWEVRRPVALTSHKDSNFRGAI